MKCREFPIDSDRIWEARTEALKRVCVQAARTAFSMLETSRNSEIPHRTAMPNCLMSKHKIQPVWFELTSCTALLEDSLLWPPDEPVGAMTISGSRASVLYVSKHVHATVKQEREEPYP